MLRLAIAGCGVMGRRHVKGLARLREVGMLPFELVAAIDPIPASAAALADLAEDLLGARPREVPDLAAALAAGPLDALDLTTAPALHPPVAEEAFAAGLHVMVEKPIALTVRGGLAIEQAAIRAGRVLSVAENYRRDPINRLAKALIDAGAIGRPYLAQQASSGWGEKVIITPWRHRRQSGGIAVDMGVHYGDILEYLLGPVVTVGGMGAIVDETRVGPDGAVHPADAQDLTVGMARFASGALASWMLDMAGRGGDTFVRAIHGTGGTLAIPNDRTGQPLRLVQWNGGHPAPLTPEEQLALVPEFTLDPATAALFGGTRLASYDLPWADTDANLLAIEYDDFARAIVTGASPEVDGRQGLRALAISYALLESGLSGRFVQISDLLALRDSPYQDGLPALG
ncbi:MAG: Gfo/Idh/MocA family protein [Thermomicrobiales bacterium]